MRSLLPDGRYVFDATIKFAGYETQNRSYQKPKFSQTGKKVIKKEKPERVFILFTKAQTVSRGLKNGVINAVIISIYPRFTAYRVLLNPIKIARIDNDNGKNIKILF